MKDNKFFDLCARRLTGSISSEEEVEFAHLLESQPELQRVYSELEKQWNTSGKLRLQYQTNPMDTWEKFSKMKSDHRPKTIRWAHFATRLAAMIILTIGLGFLFRELGKSEPYYYATFEGETKWVTLPDSSKVRLNESTLLTVAEDFNENERNVKLKGEAFFEIARNESRPFIIQTDQAKTRVLGTSFNIRALEEEEQVGIYVVSGKVSFSSTESELILTKGMSANYSKVENQIAMGQSSGNVLAWHSENLKFDDTPLSQVFEDLSDYFKVEFSVANNQIYNCRFTGEFKQPDLEEILKVISISADIFYTKNNNSYTISGEGCTPSR